ncbi:unnamed protein product [Rotaria sp. Silwood2]|nr:unnamed protein product [Rotaria sp. Silwood2]CAF3166108.1 unnamed protein product [Rotaria sp. Silwood2]
MLKYFIIGLLFITSNLVKVYFLYFIEFHYYYLDINFSFGAYVRICNQGVYLAKCYLESQSFTYEIQIHKYDTGLFPIFQCSRLDIPFDAVWTYLECKALTFIAIYSTIFTQEFSSIVVNSCYTIKGTILNPTWSETRC